MKRIYLFISTRIKLGFLFIIILVPAILALPKPLSWKPFYYNELSLIVELSNVVLGNESTPFVIPHKIDAIGKSPFLYLLGIETGSMPTFIDISNTSKIIGNDGVLIDSQTFLDKGGVVDIFVNLNQDNKELMIKVPLATSTREFITATNASHVDGEIRWGVGNTLQTEKLWRQIVFDMTAKIGFEFKWNMYLVNFFILLGGWIIFLSSLIQVFHVLIKDKMKSKFYTAGAIEEMMDLSNELIPDEECGKLAKSLTFLPTEVVDFLDEKYAFLSPSADGWTLNLSDERLREKEDLKGFILLHPDLWEKDEMTIAYTVAHESVHAFRQHGDERTLEQEKEADKLAVEWLSEHFKKKDLLKVCFYLGKH